jgi:biotin transport system substrate-specific component
MVLYYALVAPCMDRRGVRARLRLLSVEKCGSRLRAVLREMTVVLAGVCVLGASSRVSFNLPVSPVPFTLQTMVLTYIILLVGRRAWRIVLAYVLGGLAGLPLFAYGGGPWYVLSPTFGYIIGFLAASILGGFIVGEGRLVTPRRLILAATATMTTIYAFGVLYLTAWYTLFKGLSLLNALAKAALVGVLPFIIWDALKTYASVGLLTVTNKIMGFLDRGRTHS